MNYINEIRTDIKTHFDKNTFNKVDFEIFISPSQLFRIEATELSELENSRELTKVEIYLQHTDEKIFDFFINDSRFFHGFVRTNDIEYFICAEDILGGQTVIDLTNRKIAGYSPNKNGFIWTDFHVSPDGKKLATIGCYWACPYIIKVFDFSKPLDLPLKETQEIELLDNDEIILAWLDDKTLKMKGIHREREAEYSDGGGMRWKIIKETPLERVINLEDNTI